MSKQQDGATRTVKHAKVKAIFSTELPRAVTSTSPEYSGKSPLTALNSQLGKKKKGKMEILTAVIAKASGVRGVFCSGLRLSDLLVSAGL